jgi:hypothetical protein
LPDWLERCRRSFSPDKRKGAHSLLLAVWEIWKERNRRIFQLEELAVDALVERIREKTALWNLVGANIPFDPG